MKTNTRKHHPHILALAALALLTLATASCTNRKFRVEGHIADARDSVLYFENAGLNGPVAVDSVKLGEDGAFAFTGKAPGAPEFYRLRIAGQIINVAVDSTETISIKASYPTMATAYEVSGSAECEKIKELTLMQTNLQTRIAAIANATGLTTAAAEDSIRKVTEAYKDVVKREYIFKEPMKAYAYFALFQAIRLGYANMLIFNPRSSEDDVKVFAAVATSWDTYYPKAERGLNLHNIAIEGMKNVRILRAQQNQAIDADKVDLSGVIDMALRNNKGGVSRLSDLKGKVVLLDFHLFAGEGSTQRIMTLRDLYNKYHAQGLEIYQVSVDPDEHFWKTQTAALPWISVRADEADAGVLGAYNVQAVPTFFLLGKDANVYKRDIQIKDIDEAIKSLL